MCTIVDLLLSFRSAVYDTFFLLRDSVRFLLWPDNPSEDERVRFLTASFDFLVLVSLLLESLKARSDGTSLQFLPETRDSVMDDLREGYFYLLDLDLIVTILLDFVDLLRGQAFLLLPDTRTTSFTCRLGLYCLIYTSMILMGLSCADGAGSLRLLEA